MWVRVRFVDERELLERLRARDEEAFAQLVREWSPSMLRVARMYVSDRAAAEEVVQEAWLGVLQGIDRFEGRSALKTWAFRILANRAMTKGAREARSVPFAVLAGDEAAGEEPAVDADRFTRDGAWASPPRQWDESPELALRSEETLRVARAAIARLPPMQRLVILMRDLEGFGSEETCNALEISETNQRVLLHRARAKVRQALENHFGEADEAVHA
jgi:RNA polymerase sigma-70 factor (ECF subfamily)